MANVFAEQQTKVPALYKTSGNNEDELKRKITNLVHLFAKTKFKR